MSSEHVEVLRQAIAELRQDNIPTLRRATAVQKADAAIASLSAPQSGEWVLVPRGPTQAMLDAGHWPCIQGRGAKSVWATMLAAAPQQPPAEAQPVYAGVDLEGGWIRATAPAGVEDLSCCGGNDETPKSHCMDCSRYPGQLAQQPTPPSAPVGVAADILRIVDTAIDVCNDRDRPAMAEDLEAVRLYVEQASAPLAQQPAAVDDAALLDAMAREYWKLDPFDMPTPGGDDADVGWRVIEYHGDEPREREVAVHYADDPRAALRAAIAAQQGGEA